MRTTVQALMVVLLAAAPAMAPPVVATDWADTGTDWGTGGSWVGGVEPSGTVANLPSDGAIANMPTVGTTGTRDPSGVTIDNSQADYNIAGASANVLTIGSGGLALTGGGTTTVSPQITIGADQTWDIGAGSTLVLNNFRMRAADGIHNVTKTGAGTMTINGREGSGPGGGSRPVLDVNQGVLNINWGYAWHNSVRPTIRSSGTGVANINVTNGASFLYVQSDGGGETILHADMGPEGIHTGRAVHGGTITVADGATVKAPYGNWPIRMLGGTIRTLGAGVLETTKMRIEASALTATIQGTVRGPNSQPTATGGGGLWAFHDNSTIGTAALHLDLQADIQDAVGGTTGVGINHGYNLFRDATFRLSGANSYTGETRFAGGRLLLGSDSALGAGSAMVYIGFPHRGAPVRLLTDAAVTIAKDVQIVESTQARGTGNDPVTIGGNSAHVSTFSGDFTLEVGPDGTAGTSDDGFGRADLYLTAAAGGTVNFDGTLMPGAVKGVRKQGAGTVNLNGVNTYTGNTVVEAGTLGGSGSIAGALVLNANTSVAPGSSAGMLNVGSISFSQGNSLQIELLGNLPGDEYDRLVVASTVDIAGVGLDVTLGFDPDITHDFTILAATGLAGEFNGLSDGALMSLTNDGSGNSFDFTIHYGQTDAILHYEAPPETGAIPEPATLALLAAGGLGVLARRRRRA